MGQQGLSKDLNDVQLLSIGNIFKYFLHIVVSISREKEKRMKMARGRLREFD